MKRLLSIALMVQVTLVGMVSFSRAAEDPFKPKTYYLTGSVFDGSDAITACDSGFHMARGPEIRQPSNLEYASRTPTVYDSITDRGLGPPLNRMGWVRSGVYAADGFVYDCDDNRSALTNQLGMVVALSALTSDSAVGQPPIPPIMWWQETWRVCSQLASVWCVEDPR